MFQKVSKVSGVSKKILSLTLLFALASCTLIKQDQQTETQTQPTPTASQTAPMTLFFPNVEGTSLDRASVNVEDNQKNSKLWVQQMFEQLLTAKEGFSPVFAERIEIYSVFFEKDAMFIDCSSNIQKSFQPNIAKAQLALDALLSSIKTNFPQVQNVKFLSEHEDSPVVFGHFHAQQAFSLKDL